MNLGTILGRFVEKTGGQKSRATVPLKFFWHIVAGSTIFHVGLKYTEVWSSLAHQERPTQRILRDLGSKDIMSFFVEGHQIIKNNSYRTAKIISLSPAFVRLLFRTGFFRDDMSLFLLGYLSVIVFGCSWAGSCAADLIVESAHFIVIVVEPRARFLPNEGFPTVVFSSSADLAAKYKY